MDKRSVTISGHRTSVSLEPEFWRGLEMIANARGVSLPRLIAEVDARRAERAPAPGLASALRVFVLEEAQKA